MTDRSDADRAQVVTDLVRLRGPVEQVTAAASRLAWDDRPVVTLTSADLIAVLRLFLTGRLSVEEMSDWAAAVVARDDIAYEDLGRDPSLRQLVTDLAEPEFLDPELSQITVARAMLGGLEGTVGDPALFRTGRDLTSRMLAGPREFAPAWLHRQDVVAERFDLPASADLTNLPVVVNATLAFDIALVCRTGADRLEEPVTVADSAVEALSGFSFARDGDLLLTEPYLETAVLLTGDGYGLVAGPRQVVDFLLAEDRREA